MLNSCLIIRSFHWKLFKKCILPARFVRKLVSTIQILPLLYRPTNVFCLFVCLFVCLLFYFKLLSLKRACDNDYVIFLSESERVCQRANKALWKFWIDASGPKYRIAADANVWSKSKVLSSPKTVKVGHSPLSCSWFVYGCWHQVKEKENVDSYSYTVSVNLARTPRL